MDKWTVLSQVERAAFDFVCYGRKGGGIYNPPNREDFRDMIASGGLTVDEIVAEFRKQLVLALY